MFSWVHLYLFIGLAGLALSLCLTPFFQYLAERTDFLDRPRGVQSLRRERAQTGALRAPARAGLGVSALSQGVASSSASPEQRRVGRSSAAASTSGVLHSSKLRRVRVIPV